MTQFPELQQYGRLKLQRTRWGLYVDEILDRCLTEAIGNKYNTSEIVHYLIDEVGGNIPRYKDFLLKKESIRKCYEKKELFNNLSENLAEHKLEKKIGKI